MNVFEDTSVVVALELIQKGMLVDNKAFTGEHITIPGRATFVLIKKANMENCASFIYQNLGTS